MARIPLVESVSADEATQAFYAEVASWLKPFAGQRANGTRIPQLWRALAHNLQLDRYINDGSQYFMSRWPWGQQNLRLRQIIIFTITRQLRCEYAYAGNWPIAEKAGMSRAEYDAFANLESILGSPLFVAGERQLIRYVSELGVGFNASDTMFEAMVANYGATTTMEITAFVGFRMMTSLLINTLQIADD